MDDKFSDRMTELADISDDVLQQRWSTVVQVANSVDADAKVRLVLIACGETIDRDADEWFWRPFREKEANFKVDAGNELHTRLAEAATRHLINDEEDRVTATLVRLAINAGYKPKIQELIDDAAECLRETRVEVPGAVHTKGFWTEQTKEALHANPSDPANLEVMIGGAQAAVVAVTKQLNAMTRWARFADARFTSDQLLIEWLLNGVRSDGRAWSDLSAAAAAVDAARELAGLIVGAPQERHEASVLQVLAVAGHEDVQIKGSVKDVAPLAEPPPTALALVTPILSGLAANKAIPRKKPTELALRTLWEARAVSEWKTT